MKIGDVVQSAMWITGEEPPEMRQRYERDVVEAIDYLCTTEGYLYAPVIWTEKRPEAEDVPEVPDHIQGQCVRLLVAEATVTAKRPAKSHGSFVANLELKDLQTLREATRRSYARHFHATLADAECDEMIEQCGPEAALATLRQAKH